MAASVEVLSEQRTQNWLKSHLAVSYARKGLTGFVSTEFHEAHQRLLKTICIQYSLKEGTPCTSCTISSILPCPTRGYCIFKNHCCKFHGNCPTRPCENNICNEIKSWIQREHRFVCPSWRNTDATKWSTDALEISKCFLSPDGYKNVKRFEEFDFNGLISILINCKIFTGALQLEEDILMKAREEARKIRHNVELAVSDDDLNYLLDTLLHLLKIIPIRDNTDESVEAASKIRKLQNDTMPIATLDIKSVLDEGIENHASRIPKGMKKIRHAVKHEVQRTVSDITTLDRMKEVTSELAKYCTEVKEEMEELMQRHIDEIKSVSEDERRQMEFVNKQDSHTKTETVSDDNYHDEGNALSHQINDQESNVLTKNKKNVPITVLLESAKQNVPRSEYISLTEFSDIIASSRKKWYSSISVMKENQTTESTTLRLQDRVDAQRLENQELESADGETSRNKCIVCFDREITCIIKPCNHFVTCLNCLEMQTACPYCRGEIKEVYCYTDMSDDTLVTFKSDEENSEDKHIDMSEDTLVTFKSDEENSEDKQIIARRLRKLRTIGELPDQTLLNELCSEIGRRSKVVARVCDDICDHIKTLDENILHVWASYVKETENKVIFVVLVRGNVRLEQKLKYLFIKRIENEYNFEAKDVMFCESRKKYSLPQNDLEKLKETISKNAPELMKRHKHLSVISGSSVRSRNYGINPINALELVQEACIVLYVSTKGYIPIDEEPFEKYYDGVAVDVREGEFVPFVYANERQDKLTLCCQIGSSPDRPPKQDMNRMGSLGCFIDHPEYSLCALTCAHVLLFPWGLDEVKSDASKARWPHFKPHDVVYQPANSNNPIGQLVQVIYDEGDKSRCGMEVALFQIDQRLPESGEFPAMRNKESGQDMTFDSGKSYGLSRIGEHEAIKFGPTTDRTVGKFQTEEDCMSVKTIRHEWDYEEFRITLHKQLCVLGDTRNPNGKFADIGDSGSLVFIKDTRGDLVCVGIVEGGTSYGATVVTPIKPILQKLGVSEIKSFDRENVWKKINDMDGKLNVIDGKLNTIVSILSRNDKS